MGSYLDAIIKKHIGKQSRKTIQVNSRGNVQRILQILGFESSNIISLEEYGIEPIIVDPVADAEEAKHEYGIDLVDIKDVEDADCIVLTVAHDVFKQLGWDEIDSLYGDFENKDKILIDVKSILGRKEIEEQGYSYWRL